MSALSFWLDYVDAHEGLWERSGDTILAILPERLATKHDLPESALVTDDPDISREDGVLFLGAGHPEIGRAAESVITTGDVGTLTLPHRTQPPPSTEDLLAKVRDLIAVDHGRIDATGSPIRTHRPTLRLSALVSHTVSAEDHFTETAECLVDVPSRIAWPEDAAAHLRQAMLTTDTAPSRRLPANSLVPALAAAHEVLDATAAARGRILSAGADAERDAELSRPATTTPPHSPPSTSAGPARTPSARPCWTPEPRRRPPNVTGAWPRSTRNTGTSTRCALTASIWSTYQCGGWTPMSAAATVAGR